MKKNLLLVIIASFAIALSNCKKDDEVCTEEYRLITLKVNGPALDSTYSVVQSSGEKIHFENPTFNENNSYIVLEDNHLNYVRNKTEIILFKGFANGQNVVSETYEIRGDNCHISLIKGKIIVNL